MAELADALDSGSSESNFMQVQVLFPAPPPRDSDIDTISGSFLLHLFGSEMQIWGISRWNWRLAGENCRITFLWIKYSICFRTDSRQKRSLVYSRKLSWPQFCTPLVRKRGKRTRCYDIIRTRCTLLFWGRFAAAIILDRPVGARLLRSIE